MNDRSDAQKLIRARIKIAVSRLNYTYFLVTGLITLGLLAAAGPTEVFKVSYHRVADKVTYVKNPAKYEPAAYRHPETGNEVYIERQPTLHIFGGGIESVTVRKNKIYGDSSDERADFKRFITKSLGAKTGDKKDENANYPVGSYYTLTFKLKSSEWEERTTFFKKEFGSMVPS